MSTSKDRIKRLESRMQEQEEGLGRVRVALGGYWACYECHRDYYYCWEKPAGHRGASSMWWPGTPPEKRHWVHRVNGKLLEYICARCLAEMQKTISQWEKGDDDDS